MSNIDNKKRTIVFLCTLTLLFCFIILSITSGGSSIGFSDVVDAIFNYDTLSETTKTIIFKIRFPRMIAAIFAGATLAASGILIKAVVRNPLADTGLLGIQSGASFVAMIILIIFPNLLAWLPLAAFFGGLTAYILLNILAFKNGIHPLRLVLAGVAVNSLFGSAIGMINIFYSDRIQNALSWLNGSFANVSVDDAKIIVLYSLISLTVAIFCIPKCNLLALDDLTILNLGENLNVIRFILSTIAVLLSSVSVAIVGVISFVGLVVPHIGRMLVGSNHKVLLPFSMLLGSVLVLGADTLQVILFAPMEVPVGIIISALGAPFFLFLLRKENI